MNKYIRFLYYIYLNKAVIPWRDGDALEIYWNFRAKYVRVNVQHYAQLAANELKRANE